MNFKKFLGNTVPEAMAQVKDELGDDAIIIHTKKIKTGGVLGLFKKEKIEILAAIDQNIRKKAPQRKPIEEKVMTERSYVQKSQNMTYEKQAPIQKNEPDEKNFNQDIKTYSNFKNIDSNLGIKKEIDGLKNIIMELNKKIDNKVINDENLNENIVEIRDILCKRGLSQDLVVELLGKVVDEESLDEFSKDEIKRYLKKMLEHKFATKQSKEDFNFSKKLNVFIGPTGVGKTTTLAKLASIAVLESNKKIGFLTMDTYRISAVEQLKTYGEILGVPVEVAYDLEDVKYALNRLSNKDLIFVDTSGRSHKNNEHMMELKKFLDEIEEKEVFMVLSAHTHIDDIRDIIEKYSFIQKFNIIVTKLDETSRSGVIFDIISTFDKPVTHTTFGQGVPEDIEVFKIENFVNYFLRET